MPGSENNTQYSAGYRINPTGAQEAFLMQRVTDSVSEINSESDPNGVHVANPGSMAHARDGNWWRKETGTGNTGWVLANGADLYITPYIVDILGGPGSAYTTIQAAIDAAVADGASDEVFKVIFLRPGIYVENLDIYPGIIIWGTGERESESFEQICRIDGNHTLNGEDLLLYLKDVEMYNNLNGVDTFTRSAAEEDQGFIAFNVSFFNATTAGSILEGFGSAIPTHMQNCEFNYSAGHLLFSGDINLRFEDCSFRQQIYGQIECTTCSMYGSSWGPQITATASVIVQNSSFHSVKGTCDANLYYVNVFTTSTNTGDATYDYVSSESGLAVFDGNQTTSGQKTSLYGNTYTPIRSAGNVVVGFSNETAQNYVGITDTSAPRTVTLIQANIFVNRSLKIKDESMAASPTNPITVSVTGGALINGLATYIINSPGACVEFMCNGTAYFTLNDEYLSMSGGLFGDASDGSVTFDGSTTILGMVPAANVYTLTRDFFFSSTTINSGVSIITNGFRLYCRGVLTNNGTIHWNGNTSPSATAGAAISNAASSISSVTSNTGSPGTPGGNGGTAAGSNGPNHANTSLGSAGGAGGLGSSGAGGAAGTLGIPRAIPRAYPFSTAINSSVATGTTIQGASGGGGGGGDGVNSGGGGGGGAGIVCLIVERFGGTGNIRARGGNGFTPSTGNCGGGGGGGGGAVLITSRSIQSGAIAGQTIDANGGAGGTGVGTGANGTAGTNGILYLVAV